jgi:aquaporin Z
MAAERRDRDNARESGDAQRRDDLERERDRAAHAATLNFANPSREWRRIFAEAWGTFLLVLVAVGGAIAADADPARMSYEAAAVAPGVIVMAVIYFMGSVSGAHINPAVTLAFALRGNFPWARVPLYLVAQIVGGIAAAAFLRVIFGVTGNFGATLPGPGLGDLKALAVEIVATAGLVNTILGTASGARNVGTNAAIAVGGYIAVAGVWAASFSGASMNPARSLAPDIVRGAFGETWIYVVGPILGAAIGVAFEWILKGRPTRAGSKAAQGSDGD